MKLIYQRCRNCFPDNKYPFFQFEVQSDEEFFENPVLQFVKCKIQLLCLGDKDKF